MCPGERRDWGGIVLTPYDARVSECARSVLRSYPTQLSISRWHSTGMQGLTAHVRESLTLWKVFLVLRDHLGDENLGKAGGVLYEMIEVDCHHTDDPGAAFQRWRHDHMRRHVRIDRL